MFAACARNRKANSSTRGEGAITAGKQAKAGSTTDRVAHDGRGGRSRRNESVWMRGCHAPQPPPPRSAARAAQPQRALQRSAEAACAANNHRPASRKGGEPRGTVEKIHTARHEITSRIAPRRDRPKCSKPPVHAEDLFRGQAASGRDSAPHISPPRTLVPRHTRSDERRWLPGATRARTRGHPAARGPQGAPGESQSHRWPNPPLPPGPQVNPHSRRCTARFRAARRVPSPAARPGTGGGAD